MVLILELYFGAHRDTRYVLEGVMDFIKNDCLSDLSVTLALS